MFQVPEMGADGVYGAHGGACGMRGAYGGTGGAWSPQSTPMDMELTLTPQALKITQSLTQSGAKW